MASTLTNLLYHVVFSTKGRLKLIGDDFAEQLHAYMGGIVRMHGGVPVQIGGIDDHIHMLIRLKADIALSETVRLVKAGSSKWVNEQFGSKMRFAWQAGYGGFSVSESAQTQVRQYVQNQRQHHARISFQDEYQLLMERHAIPFVPEYLLG